MQFDRTTIDYEVAKALDTMASFIPANDRYRDFYMQVLQGGAHPANEELFKTFDQIMRPVNTVAKALRKHPRGVDRDGNRVTQTTGPMVKSGAISKADLDVGTLTNFAQITGGQSLGYVSLDTQMARGTVRPNSFTLYNALHKSAADCPVLLSRALAP